MEERSRSVLRGTAGWDLAGSLWRGRAVVAATDPGLVRLRTAVTTVLTLLVTAAVLVGVATAAGQPVTAALLGVVVAMISSFAVRDPSPAQRVVSTLAVVVAAATTVSLSAVVGAVAVWGQVVFVAVAVAAVFAQRLGPRGLAGGTVGFMAYFLVMFLRVPLEQVPFAILAVALGAGMSLGMRELLRPRRPARELWRLLSAMSVRTGAVLAVLVASVRRGQLDRPARRRLRNRMVRARQAVSAVEDRIDAEETPLAPIGNEALSLRLFDFQLSLERLATAVVSTNDALPPAGRDEIAGHLDALRAVLNRHHSSGPARWSRLAGELDDSPAAHVADDASVLRMRHVLSRTVTMWRRVLDPTEHTSSEVDSGEDPLAGHDDNGNRDEEESVESTPSGSAPMAETLRRAAQVGVATALAIAVGEVLSPDRWFWAVITAFVVFTGTSSRGEILGRGWQRVVGTLAGVFVGIAVASFVGNNTILAVVLIVICLFLGLYMQTLSSGLMMFWITTVIGLLYGLLGQSSTNLLVVRLEETAAGAAIGVAVAYLLFPTRTRSAVSTATADFLEHLREVVDDAAATLTHQPRPGTGGTGIGARAAPAAELRRSYGALRTAAAPLTDGIAGVINRSSYRHASWLLVTCEHHARSLARIAHRHGGAATPPAVQNALQNAASRVAATIAELAESLAEVSPGEQDRLFGKPTAEPPALEEQTHQPVSSTEDALDDLDSTARATQRPRSESQPGIDRPSTSPPPANETSTHTVITAAGIHLRAINKAVEELAERRTKHP